MSDALTVVEQEGNKLATDFENAYLHGGNYKQVYDDHKKFGEDQAVIDRANWKLSADHLVGNLEIVALEDDMNLIIETKKDGKYGTVPMGYDKQTLANGERKLAWWNGDVWDQKPDGNGGTITVAVANDATKDDYQKRNFTLYESKDGSSARITPDGEDVEVTYSADKARMLTASGRLPDEHQVYAAWPDGFDLDYEHPDASGRGPADVRRGNDIFGVKQDWPSGKGGNDSRYTDVEDAKESHSMHTSTDGTYTKDFADGRHFDGKAGVDGSVTGIGRGPAAQNRFDYTRWPDGTIRVEYTNKSGVKNDKGFVWKPDGSMHNWGPDKGDNFDMDNKAIPLGQITYDYEKQSKKVQDTLKMVWDQADYRY